MELEAYKNKLKVLTRKHDTEVSALQKNYAMLNNSVKDGDIVADCIGSVKVEKVLWTLSYHSGIPSCVYRGQELTKTGKPFKKKSIRDVYQTNLKGE